VNEAQLLDKLRKVQALFLGATTDGERAAAQHARDNLQSRLDSLKETDPPIEYRFTMEDQWARTLFVALLRRYGLRPYRYRRQRYTTVMVLVSNQFVDEVLWPQFVKLDNELKGYLNQVTQRVVKKALNSDTSDADVIDEPKRLTC